MKIPTAQLLSELQLDRVQKQLVDSGIVFLSIGSPQSNLFRYTFTNTFHGASFAVGDESPYIPVRRLSFYPTVGDWVGLVSNEDMSEWQIFTSFREFMISAYSRCQQKLCKFGWSDQDGKCLKESLLFHIGSLNSFTDKIFLLCQALNECLSEDYCVDLPLKLGPKMKPQEYIQDSMTFWCQHDRKLCEFLQNGPENSSVTRKWNRNATHQLIMLENGLENENLEEVRTALRNLFSEVMMFRGQSRKFSRLFLVLPLILVAGLSMFGQETPPVAAKSVAPTYFRNVAGKTLVNDYDLGQAPVNFPLQNFETGLGETKFEQMPMFRPYGEKNYYRADVKDEDDDPVPARNIYRAKNQASTSLNIVSSAFRVDKALPSCIRVLSHEKDEATRLVYRLVQRFLDSLPKFTQNIFSYRGVDIYMEKNLGPGGLSAEHQAVVRISRDLPNITLRSVAIHELVHTILFDLETWDFWQNESELVAEHSNTVVDLYQREMNLPSSAAVLDSPGFFRFLSVLEVEKAELISAAKLTLRRRISRMHADRLATEQYQGLYVDLYGMKNFDEFWAVSVENYMGISENVDYTGYPINHEWIHQHDPELFQLLYDVFGPAVNYMRAFQQLG